MAGERFFAYAQNDSLVVRQISERELSREESSQNDGCNLAERKAGRSLEVVGDAEGGGEDTVV